VQQYVCQEQVRAVEMDGHITVYASSNIFSFELD